MKFCYGCGKTTGGTPLFCHFCGRSYDVKVCPRLHLNPRWAEACSRCGSRNLSRPQPRVPFVWRLLALVLLIVPAAMLFLASVNLVLDLGRRIRRGDLSTAAFELRVLVILSIAAVWSTLPDAYRACLRWLLKRRERNRR